MVEWGDPKDFDRKTTGLLTTGLLDIWFFFSYGLFDNWSFGYLGFFSDGLFDNWSLLGLFDSWSF